MTADEARKISDRSVQERTVREEKHAAAKAEAAAKNRVAQHQKWRKGKMTELRSIIKYYTEYGWTEVKQTLHSGSDSQHKLYGKDNILKNFEYAAELQSIIAELEKDRYVVELVGESVEHDESAAYLNSGGECGSTTPYWTYDTVLRVRW